MFSIFLFASLIFGSFSLVAEFSEIGRARTSMVEPPGLALRQHLAFLRRLLLVLELDGPEKIGRLAFGPQGVSQL